MINLFDGMVADDAKIVSIPRTVNGVARRPGAERLRPDARHAPVEQYVVILRLLLDYEYVLLATGGLAEGLCDIAVLRTAVDGGRLASAVVGHERRYCALAADDPWARRRSLPLADIPQRTVLIDRRTGTTTPDLWPAAGRPAFRDTRDIDDWLAAIAAGDGVGITPEGTTAQYRRDGIVFRPLRGAPPIIVQMIWRRHDPHPSTHAAVAMATELYRRRPGAA